LEVDLWISVREIWAFLSDGQIFASRTMLTGIGRKAKISVCWSSRRSNTSEKDTPCNWGTTGTDFESSEAGIQAKRNQSGPERSNRLEVAPIASAIVGNSEKANDRLPQMEPGWSSEMADRRGLCGSNSTAIS